MEASDPIGKFIKTMGRFSRLLPVPELSAVLNLVEPIYEGIEELISAGKGQLDLGYQQTFCAAGGGGENDLSEGYFAAILAEESQVDPDSLCIVNGNLKVGSPGKNKMFMRDAKFLEGYSYMLFRIEKRTAQDWESLTRIKELVYQAQDAVFKREYDKVLKTLWPAIKTAIYRSPDLTKIDRKNMVVKIHAHLREIGMQGVTGQKRSLYSIMQRPEPVVDAAMASELETLEQLFEN